MDTFLVVAVKEKRLAPAANAMDVGTCNAAVLLLASFTLVPDAAAPLSRTVLPARLVPPVMVLVLG